MITEIEWRAPVRAEAAELTALERVLVEHAGAAFEGTVERTEEEFDDPAWNAATDGLVAANPDGAPLGLAYVVRPPADGYLVHGFGGVHPDHRGYGVGSRLVDWSVGRTTAMRVEAVASRPWELLLDVVNDEESAAALLRKRGFSPVRYWFDMTRDVTTSVAPAPLPDGLRIEPYDVGLDRAFYDAHIEAFADHWGYQPRPYESWLRRTSSSGFRPTLTFLALTVDGEIAGYLMTRAGADPERAEMSIIGTRGPWRGKGVASALIAQGLAAYAEAGLRIATLGVDTHNPTGALGVYERMGFAVEARWTTYSRTISG